MEIPDSVDGKSFLPLLRGESNTNWRDYIHTECAPSYQALTDGKEKYICFVANGEEQLFDLVNDPNECANLAGKPERAEKMTMWRDRMIKELNGRPEGFTDGEKLISGRPYPGVIRG